MNSDMLKKIPEGTLLSCVDLPPGGFASPFPQNQNAFLPGASIPFSSQPLQTVSNLDCGTLPLQSEVLSLPETFSPGKSVPFSSSGLQQIGISIERLPRGTLDQAETNPIKLSLLSLSKSFPKKIRPAVPFPDSDVLANIIPWLEAVLIRELSLGAYQGNLFRLRGTKWVRLPKDALIEIARSLFADIPAIFNLSPKVFGEVYDRLVTNPKILLANAGDPNPFNREPDLVNLNDCVYDLRTGQILNSDPDFYFTTQLQISSRDLHRYSPPDVFLSFLESCFDGDQALCERFLEILGVLLVGKRQRSIFVLFGPTSCGKSVILTLLQRMIGLEHVQMFNRLSDLDGDFFLGDLIGKSLLYCSDFPDKPLNENGVALLKQLSGDPLSRANRKYKDATIMENTCNIVIATNHPIRTKRKDSAFSKARLVVLPFSHSIPKEDQDPDLVEKLFEERGAIFLMAMESYRSLKARNFCYTECPDFDAETWCTEDENSPSMHDGLHMFVKNLCISGPDLETLVSDLFSSYTSYCQQSGYLFTKKASSFSRLLKQDYPDIQLAKTSDGSARKVIGLSMKNLS